MAQYEFQVASGSATGANDLGNVAVGVRNDALAQLNPTNLAYGFYAVDASGRLFVTGTVGVSASNLTANVTQGTTPWTVSGNVSATQVGVWGVTSSAVTASANVDNDAYAAGTTRGYAAFGLVTGASPSWSGSALRPLRINTDGSLAVFTTAVWGVSGSVTISGTATIAATTVTASQNGVIWGVTSSAVTASANVDGDTYAQGVTRGYGAFGLVTAASPGWAGSAMRPIRINTDGSQAVFSTAGFSVNIVSASGNNLTMATHGVNQAGGGLILVGIAAEFDDALPATVTENNYGNLRISTNRNLYTTLRDAAGNERGLNIDAQNNFSVTAGQGGTIWGVTSSGVTATAFISGTATVVPATATGVTADALGGANSQIVAGYNYIRTSGANTWDRWQSVLSGATASGVGVPMVADMWQFDDTSTVSAVENFFGVPRMNASRIAYVTATATWPIKMQLASVSNTTALTISTAIVQLTASNASRLALLIVNNGAGRLFVGEASSVATAGSLMGVAVPGGGRYSDTGNGVGTGALWGVYTSTATTQNVVVIDRS